MKRLIYGVGVNDSDYVVQKKVTVSYINGKQKQKQVWRCPFYQVWVEMLKRAYSVRYKDKNKTYIGVTTCEAWHVFSVFRAWMQTQEYYGMQLDKDILFLDNKIYSPTTCVFVSKQVNSFVTDSKSARGAYKIGVSWHNTAQKFAAYCSNPTTGTNEFLGYFEKENEAHLKWLAKKLEHAKVLAEVQSDVRVSNALINRYANYTQENNK
jgi:hypothetical protein